MSRTHIPHNLLRGNHIYFDGSRFSDGIFLIWNLEHWSLPPRIKALINAGEPFSISRYATEREQIYLGTQGLPNLKEKLDTLLRCSDVEVTPGDYTRQVTPRKGLTYTVRELRGAGNTAVGVGIREDYLRLFNDHPIRFNRKNFILRGQDVVLVGHTI